MAKINVKILSIAQNYENKIIIFQEKENLILLLLFCQKKSI